MKNNKMERIAFGKTTIEDYHGGGVEITQENHEYPDSIIFVTNVEAILMLKWLREKYGRNISFFKEVNS